MAQTPVSIAFFMLSTLSSLPLRHVFRQIANEKT